MCFSALDGQSAWTGHWHSIPDRGIRTSAAPVGAAAPVSAVKLLRTARRGRIIVVVLLVLVYL